MKLLALRIVIALAAALLPAVSGAAPEAGKEFELIEPARQASTGDRIEVIEFFYYGCPVCYEAQPHIAKWLAKAGPGIALLRIPAVTTDAWESFARTFYALDAMGQIGRLHWPIYDNHHFDGRQLNEEPRVKAWIAANGLDAEQFAALRQSPEVTAKVDGARKMLDSYGVRGVPSFVVDGKYLTSARMAGGVRELIEVVEFLVQQARRERGTR